LKAWRTYGQTLVKQSREPDQAGRDEVSSYLRSLRYFAKVAISRLSWPPSNT
jgi:hypothetical protein